MQPLSVPTNLEELHLKKSFGSETDQKVRVKREDSKWGSIPLIYYHSQLIIGEIYVGTDPTQKLTVQFNIYTAESWLISGNATVFHATGFNAKERYPNTSKTSVPTEEPFATDFGYVTGLYFYDTLDFGRLRHPRIPFGVAYNAGYWISYEPIDGVFGLSTAPAQNENVETAIHTLTEDLETPVYSIYLNKSKTYNMNGTGLLTIGKLDDINCVPNYVYADFSNPPTWQIAAFNVSGEGLPDTEKSTIELRNLSITVSDWGSWFVTSKEVAHMISVMADAMYNDSTGNYDMKSCEVPDDIKNRKVYFQIGTDGTKISMKVEDFISEYDGVCILAIYANSENADCNWYFPANFVRTHCIAVNVKENKMGFADIRPNST